jgi:SAM-dependent methyltransferase
MSDQTGDARAARTSGHRFITRAIRRRQWPGTWPANSRNPVSISVTQALALRPVVRWLDDQSLGAIYSGSYWNDLDEEKKKEWWITDGGDSYERLERYLATTALMDDYRVAEQAIAGIPRANLAVADLAAGIGWSSALISRLSNVGSVHAVELSIHRLDLLFPEAVGMFAGNPSKLDRYLGSFYDLKFASTSMDVVFLSQAFHHAANPLRLLMEIDRVLTPGGMLILIGETFIGLKDVLRRMARVLVRTRQLNTNFFELFPPDGETGDHYYRMSDYHLFMQLLGYDLRTFSVQKKQSVAIVAQKRTE